MMIRCPDCRRKVSEQAKSCPGCGHPFTPQELVYLRKKQEKRMVIMFIGISVALTAIFIANLVGPEPPKPKPYIPTPEERLEDRLTALILASMHNPNSYEHVSTHHWKEWNRLYAKQVFRGTNAFGGVVTNWVVVEGDANGNILRIVQKGP